MKKNRIARIATLLAGVFSLASCDLGAFFQILGSLSPTSGEADDPREHLSINLDYHDGEHYTATKSAYVYEDINDSTQNFPCRSYGNIKLLVIPVKIKGYESVATQSNLQRIQNTFFGETEDTGWESVSSFYKKSSYGALNITGVVPDQWGDGYIDGVWLVYGSPNHKNDSSLDQKLWWAYNFKDYSVAGASVVANPVAYSYCWASYDFMDNGEYEPKGGLKSVDAHTYIHETGHLMGLEDYYVASQHEGEQNYGPMGAVDMMDFNIIDHNAWSKFAYGWIKPYVVDDSCEITLREMVAAYSAFANGGMRVEPVYVSRITDNRGNVVAEFTGNQTEIMSEDTYLKMLSMLLEVVNSGTGARLRYAYGITADMGGKTGTTNFHSDGWFMGFTPELVTGVWVGGEERYIHFNSMAMGQGAEAALPILGYFMKWIYDDKSLPYKQSTKFEFPKNFNPCGDELSGYYSGGGGGWHGGGGGDDGGDGGGGGQDDAVEGVFD